VESYAIGAEMKKVGFPDNFIVAAVTTANDFEGVFNLLRMWANASDPAERDAIVSDIQELIDDCAQPEKVEGVYVRFDDPRMTMVRIPVWKQTAHHWPSCRHSDAVEIWRHVTRPRVEVGND
jgi:hypothetical protein